MYSPQAASSESSAQAEVHNTKVDFVDDALLFEAVEKLAKYWASSWFDLDEKSNQGLTD